MKNQENDQARFERYRKTLVAIIQKTIPNCKIYLFGSRARNTHRSGADVDVALDAGQPIPLETLLKIYGEFDQTTIPLELDLVDMQNVSDEMRDQIQLEKIKWAA
jgi:predicted nucleotidyltransferase